jgi:ribonuclease-3
MNLSSLEKTIGIKFNDKNLLKQALVHRSYLNENPDFYLADNERLEFLGDAVLELIVTEYLYRNYPNPEGELTNWRAALVNAKMLSEIASRLKMNDYLLLSRGEAKDTGRARQYIMANAFEALIGAIYLDQDYRKTAQFIEKKVLQELPRIIKQKLYQDPKSRFQEEAQDRYGITPVYEVIKEWGPDHAKQFVVGLYLNQELVAQGQGASKQEAQEKAAQAALEEKGWQ